MKLLPIYKWIAGSQTDFTKPFRENEALFKQAQTFWYKLESWSWLIVLFLFFFGIMLAIYYYNPHNNMPGRHYTPKHWVLFLIVTFFLTLLVSLGFEYFAIPPRLDGAFILELRIALGNAVYATLLYFIISWIWCQFKLPTNAYRLIKI